MYSPYGGAVCARPIRNLHVDMTCKTLGGPFWLLLLLFLGYFQSQQIYLLDNTTRQEAQRVSIGGIEDAAGALGPVSALAKKERCWSSKLRVHCLQVL